MALQIVERAGRVKRLLTSVRVRAFVCALLLVCSFRAAAQSETSNEYELKAVFLFHFAQFLDWPPVAFEDASTPVVIGVLGSNPFGGYLDDTIKNELVNARRLQVQRYTSVDEIRTCHILFIGRSEANRLSEILALLRNRSILTVGDTEDFVQRGGMIQLDNTRNKIHLLINEEAARAANLTISSKLLRSAVVMTPSK